MRFQAFMIIALFALAGLAPALAEELPEYPGWRLDRNQSEAGADKPAIEYKDFFTLTPPDRRPPITVDGETATRLLAGQANPETIYAQRNQPVNAKKDEAANAQVGWQVADSTYVPVGDEKSRDPAASITGSSTYGAKASAALATGAAAATGAAGATVGGMTIDKNVMGGAAGATAGAGIASNPGSGGSNFDGGAAGKAAAAAYTGATPTSTEATNLTYSQMIEKANVEATKSACARFGSYAQGGFCSGK